MFSLRRYRLSDKPCTEINVYAPIKLWQRITQKLKYINTSIGKAKKSKVVILYFCSTSLSVQANDRKQFAGRNTYHWTFEGSWRLQMRVARSLFPVWRTTFNSLANRSRNIQKASPVPSRRNSVFGMSRTLLLTILPHTANFSFRCRSLLPICCGDWSTPLTVFSSISISSWTI